MEVTNIKKKYSTKILAILLISVSIILISTVIKAKYIIQNEFYIASLNIDRTKPVIELISIANTNKGYENYANKTHTITVTVKITDKNLKDVFCDKEHIKIKIDDNYINPENMEITKVNNSKENIYQVQLKNIKENGKLKIEFLEGVAIDTAQLKSDKLDVDTNITIDNIPPKGEFVENKISEGKVNGIVNLSEEIRKLEGWNLIENEGKFRIEKEFTNNVSYILPIRDLAGNESSLEVNITQATYINLIYASLNSEVGWTYGYGNYDVAGADAIKRNASWKTEVLAFNISGNVEPDFVQSKAYIYTHWGEGSFARCGSTGMLYNYGYNPNNGKYKSMASDDLVTINGKKYFQFGGGGINAIDYTDINGNNPIPRETARLYPYGISGISLSLKDYSQYSIVYQILVNKSGWVRACSNGEECMYRKDSPMSGIRVALIPKSEKQYVLDTWNKDVGTYRVK